MPNSHRFINNNFDLLRLLFAGTVCLVHAYELSGYGELAVIVSVLSSAVAVKAFFVVSGFLIFMSYERSKSTASYAFNRVRRIYPAYLVAVMACAIGLVVVSTKTVTEYYSVAWLKYVVANLAFLNFLQPTLPGVFDANKLAAVNGALWTLKIEVMFYLMVPLFVWLFRKFGHLRILVAAYCTSLAYAWIFSTLAEETGAYIYSELARQLPGQISYFVAGAGLYYFFPVFERYAKYFLAAAVAVLLAKTWVSVPLAFLEPLALATLVVFFGLFLYVGNAGKYGDFSYGIYILHFPIIQLLLDSDRFGSNPLGFLAAAVVLSVMAGGGMWHFIEKRFLLRGSHYRAATSPN